MQAKFSLPSRADFLYTHPFEIAALSEDARMMPRLATAGCLLALWASAQAAPPDGLPTPGRSMSGLIEDLGDRDFCTRERATQTLRRLGKRSLPSLRAAANHNDFEIRRRANLVRVEVERAEATCATLVTLPPSPLHVNEALDLVAKQTGYRFDVAQGTGEDELFEFDIKETGFWTALDRICTSAGLGLWSIDDGTIRLVKQQSPPDFVARNGAFRVSAEGVQDTRTIRFAADKLPESRSDTLDLTLALHSEPKLAILEAGTPTISEAIDDHRHSLVEPQQSERDQARVRTGPAITRSYRLLSTLRLRRCANSTRIERIRGTIPVKVLQNNVAEAEISDLLHSSGSTVSTCAGQLTFEEMSRASDQHSRAYTLRLSIKRSPASKESRDWYTSFEQRLAVQGARGERWAIQDVEWLHRGPDDAELRLTAESTSSEAPEKLVFTSWASFEYPLEFQFRGVPLP
jgi:hypothetical protein